jgi:hypothetical protein
VSPTAKQAARQAAGAVSLQLRKLTTGLLTVEADVEGSRFRDHHDPRFRTEYMVTFTVTFEEDVDLDVVRSTVERTVITSCLGKGFKIQTVVRHPGEDGDVEEVIWRLGGGR